jgi:hypothetical protein
MELLGMDALKRVPIYPDPRIYSVNPFFLVTLAMLVIATQAYAKKEQESGNAPNAARLYKEARDHLKRLMREINASLGPGQWDGLGSTDRVAGSAMLRAMNEERTPLLELIAGLGDDGLRDGIHYDEAIAVAKEEKYPKIKAILEEHRALCANTSPSVFGNRAQLEEWVTGDWTGGAYLYRGQSGSIRVDPKGRFTVHLHQVQEWDGDRVRIVGSGKKDQGDLDVTVEAWLSGGIKLRPIIRGSLIDQTWVYCGQASRERKAFGGYYGMPGTTRDQSWGTCFF